MRFFSSLVRVWCTGLIIFSASGLQAQEPSYKSLLWEISGNGLQKPSYLFGTMHISNKMVFHLSDSFYTALKSVDVVAIELNPEQWQSEIPRLNRQSELYKYYNSTYYTDYLRENSFTENDFLSQLQASLRFEPALNDALLYRNESRMDNFQEDTYLDLYIYQTGKKLGKKTAGVETFMGSQRMMIEALVDASADKDKKKPDAGGPYFDAGQVLQDAYRRGDLDMLDSINKVTEYTQSFTEKFLYRRNEIQAASMDSIMKHQRLFVGVGAAHLPGKRGVIALLREKGYTLRPVYMQDRDASQKIYIDSLTVPVQFVQQYATDSFYSVEVPGKLNDIESRDASLKHYADMGNGSYYLITRIKTNTLFNGYSKERLLKIVDSLLYENIPGTIVSNKPVERNGYAGMDIRNRTRKGDLQHYQLWVTPSELIIFKMGGKGNYVEGKEDSTFFNSIALKAQNEGWKPFSPASGGFTVNMPAVPQAFYAASGNDQLPEWKYEATDPADGDEYAVFKKSIYSFDFIEPDSFDLRLISESFSSSVEWEDKKSYSHTTFQGRPAIDIALRSVEGDYVQARAVLYGPQYYLLLHRTKHKEHNAGAFFNSFAFAPFHYPPATAFRDTALCFAVQTGVNPIFDRDVQDMMNYVKKNEYLLKKETDYKEDADISTANFVSEETGEVIVVNDYKYPDYFYIEDSTVFWKNIFHPDSSLVLQRKIKLDKGPGTQAWMIEWSDTGSTRLIRQMVLMSGAHMLTVNTERDSTLPSSSFITDFYNSFTFQGKGGEPGPFTSKTGKFFKDYYSGDTVLSKRARSAIASVYFGKEGYPGILDALKKLDAGKPDYYELKSKFIAELGYIKDSTLYDDIALSLRQIYMAAGDTAILQNSILKALSKIPTVKAAELFKELVLQDPPAFENSYEYNELFSAYGDKLKMAAVLYPEIMNLTTIEDFKMPLRELLASLADSNYVQPSRYEEYLGNIYFDAKIALKKMQYSNENTLSRQGNGVEEQDGGNKQGYAGSGDMQTYARLLAPFYSKNPNLPRFFEKLLSVSDPDIRMSTALALLKYKQPVPDSIWTGIAALPGKRAVLWSLLKEAGHAELFPAKYRNNENIASGLIYAVRDKVDTVALLPNKPLVQKDKKTTLYFLKYRLKTESNWKLAIVGVKEEKGKPAEGNYEQSYLTDKKLDATAAGVEKQIGEQMKKIYIGQQRSGLQFYRDPYNANNELTARLADD